MDQLFNLLSSSARLDKSKRAKKGLPPPPPSPREEDKEKEEKLIENHSSDDSESDDSDDDHNASIHPNQRNKTKSKKKKQFTPDKLAQIHKEEIAHFRNKMNIKLSTANRHDGNIPDPITSFEEVSCPSWWSSSTKEDKLFVQVKSSILKNIELGRWLEPTPIQMQVLPSLIYKRRDVLGCAPTGSGKSGAFIIPALVLSSVSDEIFYGTGNSDKKEETGSDNKRSKKKHKSNKESAQSASRVRSLLLAPSRELASQLHREVNRLGDGKIHGLRTALLSKSNLSSIASNTMGGKRGLDVLVCTPLRLVECIEQGLDLGGVRVVVLDEADRLLDSMDGNYDNNNQIYHHHDEKSRDDNRNDGKKKSKDEEDSSSSSGEEDSGDSDSDNDSTSSSSSESSSPSDDTPKKKPKPKQQQQQQQQQSGSAHAKTFLLQIDTILSSIPPTAIRSLFSATMGPSIRHLSESMLRDPIDITIGSINKNHASKGITSGPTANPDIEQSLLFVGKEEGKLLAIRQLIQKGIKPPVIIFLQSKERAQALFSELLYDGIHVDVIHAGRSQSARDAAITRFRKGDTWVLICTDLCARGVDFKGVNMVINYDLPNTGVSYVHRIGRTGRAGRKGKAITLFTEADFENLRSIANVMKLSGCEVPDWMLTLKKKKWGGVGGGRGGGSGHGGSRERRKVEKYNPRRGKINTTSGYDKMKMNKKRRSIESSKGDDKNENKRGKMN